jgi:hypothetical protein
MEKEKFENIIRLKVISGDLIIEDVFLSEDLVLDLNDMIPTRNIEGAIKVGALDFVPTKYLKVLNINSDSVRMILNLYLDDIKIIHIGETINFPENISVTLLDIRFNAYEAEDWQTIKICNNDDR